MAIGDEAIQRLGTAAENRQPSAGVEEKVGSVMKQGTTDAFQLYDGTNSVEWLAAPAETGVRIAIGNNADLAFSAYKQCTMIDNSVYARKPGTTDIVVVSGVQTNA